MATTNSRGATHSLTTDVAATSQTARWLALGAISGPVLFTLAWLILGFVSPGFVLFGSLIAPYSPISHPISGLGLPPNGPYMNAAFVLSGLLLLAGVIGIYRTLSGSARPFTRRASAGLSTSTSSSQLAVRTASSSRTTSSVWQTARHLIQGRPRAPPRGSPYRQPLSIRLG